MVVVEAALSRAGLIFVFHNVPSKDQLPVPVPTLRELFRNAALMNHFIFIYSYIIIPRLWAI